MKLNASHKRKIFSLGFELDFCTDDLSGFDIVRVWELDNEWEWMFSLVAGESGYSFGNNVYLPLRVKEEIPAFIGSPNELIAVLSFIRSEMQK